MGSEAAVARSGVRRLRGRPVHAADRRHTILARVAEEQTIHVGELARDLGCSEMTIRRDIVKGDTTADWEMLR